MSTEHSVKCIFSYLRIKNDHSNNRKETIIQKKGLFILIQKVRFHTFMFIL